MNSKDIPQTYFTIKKIFGPMELKEKGSRFIGFLYPIPSIESAEQIISSNRKKYHDATHVCSAFRLGVGSERYFRYSDDGEPNNTAGLPIYNEIKGKNIFNVLAIVVRYYGGTKLGTGGLVRAYSTAIRQVIEIADIVSITIKKHVYLNFPFNYTGDMMAVINRYSIEIIEQKYTSDGVSMKLAIPITGFDEISDSIIGISKGKVVIEPIEL